MAKKEILFIEKAIDKYEGISFRFLPEGYMTRNSIITDAIKKDHDCILQTKYGDELVVFNTNQIKLADGTNTTFDGKNPDICRARVDEYKLAFCGQILLTKDPDPDAVVTIHKFKSHINWDEQEIVKRCIDEYTNPGEFFRAGKIDLEEFKRMRKEHADNFDLTCEVKNLYNRMVSWKGGTLHAQRITKSAPKVLNQYFFAEWI